MCGRPAVPSIKRETDRHRRNRVADEAAGAHDRARPLHLDGASEQGLGREADLGEHHQRHEGRAAEEEHRLDDLHPGRRDHAAEDHVDDHQAADDHHCVDVGQAEQQPDQLPRPHHLRDQVEGHDDQRAHRRKTPHRPLREAERGDVGEGVAAEIAQALGHQEQDQRPADEEAGRVDQSVITVGVDLRRNAEEGGGGHIVAGDGEAVLEAGDTAARRIEIGGVPGPQRRPAGNDEGQRDEGREHPDRGPVHSGTSAISSASRASWSRLAMRT